jgi:p-hydroxybenzoate 3-monooxygenase
MRVQVAIIGSGPAGLLLSRLLHQAGIDTIIVERRSRDHVLGRIRAGVLEPGTVDLLDKAGVGHRLHAEGLVHTGIEITFAGARHRIDLHGLTGGKHVTIYGQTEVTRDLMEAREATGARTVYEAEDVSVHDFDATTPLVRYRKEGRTHEIRCDFIAGCDGFHGVCRSSVPESPSRPTSAPMPSAGSDCCRKRLPVSQELIYVNHERGFALCSMRSPTVSRYYVQVPLEESVETGRPAVLGRTPARLDPEAAARLVTGPAIEKSIAPSGASWPSRCASDAVPGWRCGPYRTAHRRQGAQPGGLRRGAAGAGTRRVLVEGPAPGSTPIRKPASGGFGRRNGSPGG